MAELHFGSKEYFEKQSEFWFTENSKHISERDAYKKQRDELINDMQNVKRKAEAFDEIKEYTLDKIGTLTTRREFASNFNEVEYFGNLLIAYKNIEYKINDLERGSDE